MCHILTDSQCRGSECVRIATFAVCVCECASNELRFETICPSLQRVNLILELISPKNCSTPFSWHIVGPNLPYAGRQKNDDKDRSHKKHEILLKLMPRNFDVSLAQKV